VVVGTIIGDDLMAPNEISPSAQSTSEWITRLNETQTSFRPHDGLFRESPHYSTWHTSRLYEEMRTREDDITLYILKRLAGPATRLSIIREEIGDIILPQDALTESVRRIFTPVNTYRNGKVHGGVGRVDLVVAVPTGVEITVLRTTKLRVTGLRSNLNVVDGKNLELRDLEGQIRLFDTSVRHAENIRGAFFQSRYDIIGGSMSDGFNLEPTAQPPSVLKSIHGTVQVDLAFTDLDVSDLHGDIIIHNRYGTTRFALDSYQVNSSYHLEADSGTIHLKVKEPLNEDLHFVMHTLCGHIDASGLKSADRTSLNMLMRANLLSMTTRNDSSQPPAVYLNTRAGKIKIDRTPA